MPSQFVEDVAPAAAEYVTKAEYIKEHIAIAPDARQSLDDSQRAACWRVGTIHQEIDTRLERELRALMLVRLGAIPRSLRRKRRGATF